MRRSYSTRPVGRRLDSFTLIELLTVIAIIVILAALTLTAGEGVMNQAARGRAKTEMHGYSAALESYKTDNGIYPPAYTFGGTNTYSTTDPLLNTNYIAASQILYQALSGKTNYTDLPNPQAKYYASFKMNQLGNGNANRGTTGAGSTYVEDPFGYAYGYYTGDPQASGTNPQLYPPVAGTGFYDLWSTGGSTTSSTTYTNSWIVNWQ
jgi:prepilin-type N-terminal cleavage/methylation domain-containing protein